MVREVYQVFGVELSPGEYSSDYYYIPASSIKEILDWFSKNLELEYTTEEFPIYITKKLFKQIKAERGKRITPIKNMFSDKKLIVLAYHCF